MEQGQFTDEQIVAVLQGAARGGKPVGEGAEQPLGRIDFFAALLEGCSVMSDLGEGQRRFWRDVLAEERGEAGGQGTGGGRSGDGR